MTRFRRLGLVAAAVAFLAAPCAAEGARPFDRPVEGAYVNFASHYWRAAACGGHPGFFAATEGEIDRAYGAGGALGLAWPGECRAWVSDWPLEAGEAWSCSLVVHEYGHLLGRDDDDTDGPMGAGSGSFVMRPCLYGFGGRPCSRLHRRVRLHRHGARAKYRVCARRVRKYRRWRRTSVSQQQSPARAVTPVR